LPRAGEDRQHNIAIGDSGLQGFGAGLHHSGDAVLGDAAENLHELPIAVGVVLEARARIADSGAGNSQSLNGAPFLSAPGLRISTGR
jgi:hypothetical protein